MGSEEVKSFGTRDKFLSSETSTRPNLTIYTCLDAGNLEI